MLITLVVVDIVLSVAFLTLFAYTKGEINGMFKAYALYKKVFKDERF